MNFEDDKSVDRSLLIFSESTPHCKDHGAMLLLNDIWRCHGTYNGSVGTHIKFIERTCNCAISNEEGRNVNEII